MLSPMVRIRTIAWAAAGLGAACAPSATTGDFDSPSPGAKMYAIEEAIRTGDTSKTTQLVEQLDSDDPAVRLLAITALQRLTGETREYHYDDPPAQRDEAIERWVDAVNATRPQSAVTIHDNDG